MTVSNLIKLLNDMPQDAEIFYGSAEGHKEVDKLDIFALYDFTPVYYKKLRSCRSSLPTYNTIKENVVVLEYD